MRFLVILLMLGFYSGVAEAKMGYRSMFATIPLMESGNQTTAHLEFNLGGEAGLAIEGTYIHRNDDVSEDEAKETNDDFLETHGRQFAVLISRYSEPMDLGGFYWTLGLGHRTLNTTWNVEPASDDESISTALVGEDGKLNHEAVMTGMTGHGRLGYRYIGNEYPFVIGSYLGMRHFASGVEDVNANGESATDGNAPLTDLEKVRLTRRFQTRLEFAVEMGWAF